jgi:DNA-binding transcriptional MerR regulator
MLEHRDTPNVIFVASEAAQILGLTVTKIRNLTSGRNLRIRPMIGAHGTGSRNLYGREDLYRLGIATELNKDGFTAQRIQSVFDQLNASLEFAALLIVTVPGDNHLPWVQKGNIHVQVVPKSQFNRERWNILDGPIRNSLGCYVLDIGAIAQRVDHQIATFRTAVTASRPAGTSAKPKHSRVMLPTLLDELSTGRKVRKPKG